MRKLAGILSIMIILAAFACGQKSENSAEADITEQSKEEAIANFHSMDLSEYGIYGSLLIPEGKAEISENAYGGVELRVGKDFAIEILPSALSIDEKKSELANNPIYSIDYLEEGAEYIYYTKEIENSGIEKEHHLYFRKDFGDGEIYAIKTLDMGKLNKSSVEKILKSLKAATAA